MARLGLSSWASDHGCPKILVVFASTVSPLNIPIPLVSLCVPESSVFGDTLGKGVARRGKVRTPSSAISWTTSSSSKSRGAKPVGGQARAERAGGRSAGSRPPLSPQPTKSSSNGFTEPRSTTLLLLAMGTAAAGPGRHDVCCLPPGSPSRVLFSDEPVQAHELRCPCADSRWL